MAFRVPENMRITSGPLGSNSTEGRNGCFKLVMPSSRGKLGAVIMIIASDGEGWEHVSASISNRCPTWDEMTKIKHLFWDDEDCVIQFHPPKSEYVNNHPYCLHLWRPVGKEIIRPPRILVGV